MPENLDKSAAERGSEVSVEELLSPSQATPDVSEQTIRLITVTYNPGSELERFLASIAPATSAKVNVYIADNGTQHELVDELAAKYNATVVRDPNTDRGYGPGNLGYGGGVNFAAKDLSEDWIVVANPDLVFRPGALDVLVAAGLANKRAGSLGPRLLNTDGTVYPSGRALPTLGRGAGHAFLGRIWPSNPLTKAYHGTNEDTIHPVGWLSGACLLLPRKVWQELGGFDDAYFMFFEDVDLGARVGKAGYENLQVPGAVVVHEQGASWKARPENMIRAHHASARLYMSRIYPHLWQAPLRGAINAGLSLREEMEVRRPDQRTKHA